MTHEHASKCNTYIIRNTYTSYTQQQLLMNTSSYLYLNNQHVSNAANCRYKLNYCACTKIISQHLTALGIVFLLKKIIVIRSHWDFSSYILCYTNWHQQQESLKSNLGKDSFDFCFFAQMPWRTQGRTSFAIAFHWPMKCAMST